MNNGKLAALGQSLDELDKRIAELRKLIENGQEGFRKEAEELEEQAQELAEEICSDLTPWDNVSLARHINRPHSSDYIRLIFDDFIELHGDRRYGEDPAVITGLAFIDGKPVAVIGQEKGLTAMDRRRHNFGMSSPEGYRKTMRIMQLAARMKRPIITLIDTPGADCLEASEGRGISEAIATNQRDMFSLPVPIICTVIGEGGSGGAIGIGVGDRLMMLEHSYYSVITPEACAAILWRDPTLREDAAVALKLTAHDAHELGVIDTIVAEPPGGAHRKQSKAADNLKAALTAALSDLEAIPVADLLETRYQKFRNMGAPA